MTYQVKAEKVIGRSVDDVFQAIKAGRLFMNCGAYSGTIEIDFRVGGKYHFENKGMQKTNFGEFLEIIPNKKVVFTWCQDFSDNQKPDSQVSIELFADGPKTRMLLLHTGFKTQENADNHNKGWDVVITDFNEEVQSGRLRIMRRFQTSPETLYATCKAPENLFGQIGDLSKGSIDLKVGGTFHLPNKYGGIKGEFLEIIPNQKIRFSWEKIEGQSSFKDSQVTLAFHPRDNGAAVALELIHEGLTTAETLLDHRRGWESILQKIAEMLAGKK